MMFLHIFDKGWSAFSDLNRAFPQKMQNDVEQVCFRLSAMGAYTPISTLSEAYSLSDEEVVLPYRCYFKLLSNGKLNTLTELQKLVYACIALLHPDGYTREKYLRYLLDKPMEEWMLPFLLKLSGEYVKEILAVLYESRMNIDNTALKTFCQRNPLQAQRCYSRMVSYWAEYYRFEITYPIVLNGRKHIKTRLRDYVGYPLFRQCWGVSPRRKKMKDK